MNAPVIFREYATTGYSTQLVKVRIFLIDILDTVVFHLRPVDHQNLLSTLPELRFLYIHFSVPEE